MCSQLCPARGDEIPRSLPSTDFTEEIQLVREALHRKSALPLWPLEKSSIDSDGSAAALFLWCASNRERPELAAKIAGFEAILLTSRILAT
jgi:hypothetical protein